MLLIITVVFAVFVLVAIFVGIRRKIAMLRLRLSIAHAELNDAKSREFAAIDEAFSERQLRLFAEQGCHAYRETARYWQAYAFTCARQRDAEHDASRLRRISHGEVRWTLPSNDAQA